MNEIYIDNLEAIAVEQTMNEVRLTIGHTVYIMPLKIARYMAMEIVNVGMETVSQALSDVLKARGMALGDVLELAGHQKDEACIKLSL